MKVFENFPLANYNSFGVKATARHLVRLESRQDIGLLERGSFDPGIDLVLGGGSNVLFATDVAGTVYLNRLTGRQVVDDDGDSIVIDAAAGENWHELVIWSLEQGYYGLENLSLIPGLVGAAPMQNIGAYGVEISELMESVEVLDWQSGESRHIERDDCRFSYRDSRFRSSEPGRYLIISCRLRLHRQPGLNISYAGLAEELSAMDIINPDAQKVSEAVIRIRRRKLPDPAVTGNAGSFFKNPQISPGQAEHLQTGHPSIPVYLVDDGITKVSAAWMIEQCGWKGFRNGDAGVSEQHALVLVNHGNATGRDILELANRIEKSVYEYFGITLEHEPKIIEQLF